MKKLNLQLGSIKEMLTKEQMKKITGGYDPTTCCTVACKDGSFYEAGPYCPFQDNESYCDQIESCDCVYDTGC